MSWKITNALDERQKFIMEQARGEYGMAELARQFGVSRKTLYQWLARYREEGMAGLVERSRVAHGHPRALPEAMVAKILALKARYPLFGAPKLRYKLLETVAVADCPAESSIGRLLQRHGLSQAPRRRRVNTAGLGASRYEGCHSVWCADFKGWFRTGDGRICTPLTVSDGTSRYLLKCQGLGGKTGHEIVQPLFEMTMREYGVPTALHTDNGPPFASCGLGGLTALAVWCLRLGIRLERSRPGCPQDNGRHERLHRTLKAATTQPPQATLRAQQRAFDAFRQEYNFERPHEGLDGQTPGAVYVPSPIAFPTRLPRYPEYAEGWETRQVRGGGQMTWRGREVMVTKVLAGQQVGLEPQDDGTWQVYFASLALGIFDERQGRIQPPKRPSRRAAPAA
jgi:transposase InsO family protein